VGRDPWWICDGRVANSCWPEGRSLILTAAMAHARPGDLDADALILAIDASAPATQINADFTEFGRFSACLEQPARSSNGDRRTAGVWC